MAINMKSEEAPMLPKEFVDYCKTYLREGAFSWAVTVNIAKHLMKELEELGVAECRGHPPFNKVESYEIVKCGKIWVVIGKVMRYFTGGSQKLQNYEMAMGIDKNALGIWWDLNSPNSSS